MKEALARTQRALQAAEQERDELLACVRELEAERSWSASESYDSCLNWKVMVSFLPFDLCIPTWRLMRTRVLQWWEDG